MATDRSQGADVVKAVGAVIGLLAGSVALLYVAGGAALTLRLFLYGLPSLNVVAQLPREILISVALTQIVLPAVAAGSLYGVARLLLGGIAPPPRRFVGRWHERSWRNWRTRIGVSAGLALTATLLGASPGFERRAFSAEGDAGSRARWVFAIAFVLNVVVMLVAMKLRAEVAARAKGGWNTVPSVASMALVVALTALPAAFVFAGTFRLLDAKVCSGTGTDSPRIGVLIGEMSDRIYLGETNENRWHENRWHETDDAEDPLRVVSIPQSEVKEISIGSKPETGGC